MIFFALEKYILPLMPSESSCTTRASMHHLRMKEN